jgi:hypothetical protein
VGLDGRYFYDGYDGERPFEVYLLDHKRDEKRVDESIGLRVNAAVRGAVEALEGRMEALVSGLRSEMTRAQEANGATEAELARLKTRLRLVTKERDDAVEAMGKARSKRA